jgi:ABC-type transport system substrate-binding protein
MSRLTASIALLFLLALGTSTGEVAAQAQPDGQLTIAFDASIAPTFLDPGETPGIGTPFVFLYALHDALIKPLPGNDMAPCLAESWTESPDGLVYEFKLREGLRFHNGDPFTAEDVRFSFQRYRGASAKLLHDHVKAVDIIDSHRIRFVLHAPPPRLSRNATTPTRTRPRPTSRGRAGSRARRAGYIASVGSSAVLLSYQIRAEGIFPTTRFSPGTYSIT